MPTELQQVLKGVIVRRPNWGLRKISDEFPFPLEREIIPWLGGIRI
jgi:hypothetical protein